MNKEIARVTSWNDCIVIGCRLEDWHEGPHEFTVASVYAAAERDLYEGRVHESRFLAVLDARLQAAGFVYVPGAGCTCADLGEHGHLPTCGWQKASPTPAPAQPADPHARAMAAGLAAVEQALAAPATPVPCHCGQCGPVPAGAKRTPCTGAKLAGPEAPRTQPVFRGFDGEPYTVGDRIEIHPGTDLWMRGARYGDVVGYSSTPNDRVKVNLDRTGKRLWSGPEDRFRKLAVLALAALLPLLAASSAHAAGAPKAPRHGKPVAGCVKQASGKWAKLTPGGKWSTVACEPEVTMRITDRANGAREGYEVRYASPEKCTVWVAEKRADDPKVIGAAYDACIDTMAEKAGV